MPKYNQINERLIHAIIQSKLQAVNDLVQYLGTSSIEPLEDRHFLMASQQMGGTFDVALGQSLYLALALHACSVTLDPVRGNIVMTLLKRYLDVYPQEPFAIQALITFHAQVKKQAMPAQPSAFANTPFGQATASPALAWLNELEFMILNEPLAGVEAFKAYCIQQGVKLADVVAMLKENIPQLNCRHHNYRSSLKQVLFSGRDGSLAGVLLVDDLFNLTDANKLIHESNLYWFFGDNSAVAPLALSQDLHYAYFKSALNPKNLPALASSRLNLLKQMGFDVLPYVAQLNKDESIKDVTEAVSKIVLELFKVSITQNGAGIWTDASVAEQITKLLKDKAEGSRALLKAFLDKLSNEKRLNLAIANQVMASIVEVAPNIPNQELVLSHFHEQKIFSDDPVSVVQLYFMWSFIGGGLEAGFDSFDRREAIASQLLSRLVNTPYYVAALSWLHDVKFLTDVQAMKALDERVPQEQYLSPIKNNTVFELSVLQLKAFFTDDPEGRKARSLNLNCVDGRCTAAQAWIKALGAYLQGFYKDELNIDRRGGFNLAVSKLVNQYGHYRLDGGITPRADNFHIYLSYIFNLLVLVKSTDLNGLLSEDQKRMGWAFVSLVYSNNTNLQMIVSKEYKYWPEFFMAVHPTSLVQALRDDYNLMNIDELVFALLRSHRTQVDLNDKTVFRALMLFAFLDKKDSPNRHLSNHCQSFIRWFIKAESMNAYSERVDFISLAEEKRLGMLSRTDARLLRELSRFAKEKEKANVDALKSKIWAYFKGSVEDLVAPLYEKMILGEPCPFLNLIRFDKKKQKLIDTPEMNDIYEKMRAQVPSQAVMTKLTQRLAGQPSPRDAVLLLALSQNMPNSEFSALAKKHLLDADFSGDESQKAALCDALKLLSKDHFKRLKERLVDLVASADVKPDDALRVKMQSLLQEKMQEDNPFLVVLRTRRAHYDHHDTKSYLTVKNNCFPQQSLFEKAGRTVLFPVASRVDKRVKAINQVKVQAEMESGPAGGTNVL